MSAQGQEAGIRPKGPACAAAQPPGAAAWTPITYGDALRASARAAPQRTAVVGMGERLSYAEFDRRVDALALGLAGLGVRRGDHVALWMTNCPAWAACWLAAARLGAVLVPINTRFKLEEAAYILEQSDARVLISMDTYWSIDFRGMVEALLPELAGSRPGALQSPRFPQLRAVSFWNGVQAPGTVPLDAIIRDGEARLARAEPLPQVSPDDPVIIVYTSGTTGHPKGAMHSHAVLRNAANIARFTHVEPGDVVLGHMPFYHVAGAVTALSTSVLRGCTLVTMPHWEPHEALRLICEEKVTIFGGIPTHFIDCLDAIRKQPCDTSSLKSAWIGGAPVTPDVALASRQELRIEALQAVYGMTETTAATAFSRFEDGSDIVCDNKGLPIGDFEVQTFHPKTGQPVAPGEVGEVRVRGHLVMLGYYKNAAATREAIMPDGWFRTGDLGVIDAQGYLKITGRLKDMFIVGGSNAYPAEIERMLQADERIKQAVVVGVADARLGEVGYAFIQKADGAQLDADQVVAFCKANMAQYKVPRYVEFVAEFPRTTTGKIQRFVLSGIAKDKLTEPGAHVDQG